MVAFIPVGETYRMRQGYADIVAVHQVLNTPAWRPVERVLSEMTPGSVFVAQQAPAPNTYLHDARSLDEDALFPYPNALSGEFSEDRLSLVIREILPGASRTEPIGGRLPVLYCVHSGIIDEVHIETTPERQDRYLDLFGEAVFHDRIPFVPYLSSPIGQNRERL